MSQILDAFGSLRAFAINSDCDLPQVDIIVKDRVTAFRMAHAILHETWPSGVGFTTAVEDGVFVSSECHGIKYRIIIREPSRPL